MKQNYHPFSHLQKPRGDRSANYSQFNSEEKIRGQIYIHRHTHTYLYIYFSANSEKFEGN